MLYLCECNAILYVTKNKQENSMKFGYNTLSFHNYADITQDFFLRK